MLFPKSKIKKINVAILKLNRIDIQLIETVQFIKSLQLSEALLPEIDDIQDRLTILSIMNKEIQLELQEIEGTRDFSHLSASFINKVLYNANTFIHESMTVLNSAKRCIAA